MARSKNPYRMKDSRESVRNAAKTLLANIRFMSVDNPISTLAITSAIPNEGKTFVAAMLAWAMATSGRKTLVVECDMRRRSMSKQLGVHGRKGLYAVLAGETPLNEAVVPTRTKRLFFLDAEPHIPTPSDLLNSQQFAAFVQLARREYDYVVFDTPPVGAFVDAAVLGSKIDAVFMVVREDYTKRDDISRASEQLRTANVNLAGIVMNFCERSSNEYYYEYYYREGHKRRRDRRGRAGEVRDAAMEAQQRATERQAPLSSRPDISDMTPRL